jgi:prepilin-type N-terminal cleavage/methylation domain-containing protein
MNALYPPSPRVKPAFTLIEILATLAVLGLVLPAIMSGLTLCLATASHSRAQAQATALAQAKLGELTAAALWDQTSWAGDWQGDWPGYRWNARLADWNGSTLRELTVTVNWEERGRARDLSLATLIYSDPNA